MRQATDVVRVVRHGLLAVRVRLHALRQVVPPGARKAAVHLRKQQQALVVRLTAQRDGDSCTWHVHAGVRQRQRVATITPAAHTRVHPPESARAPRDAASLARTLAPQTGLARAERPRACRSPRTC